MPVYEGYQKYKTSKVPSPLLPPGKLPPTPSDIEGPFYLPGASDAVDEILSGSDASLEVSGRVVSVDGNPVHQAVLDIWQADAKGVYDEKGYKLRGKIHADEFGRYRFRTLVPGDYQIADNPPDFRCSHIHVKVTAPGCKSLTTQLYFADDPYDATDHWFDARRVIDKPNATFDFVLEKI